MLLICLTYYRATRRLQLCKLELFPKLGHEGLTRLKSWMRFLWSFYLATIIENCFVYQGGENQKAKFGLKLAMLLM